MIIVLSKLNKYLKTKEAKRLEEEMDFREACDKAVIDIERGFFMPGVSFPVKDPISPKKKSVKKVSKKKAKKKA